MTLLRQALTFDSSSDIPGLAKNPFDAGKTIDSLCFGLRARRPSCQ